MEKCTFRFSYTSQSSIGSIDVVLGVEKITYKNLDTMREDMINYINKDGTYVDSDSFCITGWSRIYD